MSRMITFDDVVRINREHTNGNGVVVDASTVMSAVGRPWQTFDGVELYPTLIGKAAALLHALACTQGFVDGNKRTAWLACVGLLAWNGVQLTGESDRDAADMVLALVNREIDMIAAHDWLLDRIA